MGLFAARARNTPGTRRPAGVRKDYRACASTYTIPARGGRCCRRGHACCGRRNRSGSQREHRGIGCPARNGDGSRGGRAGLRLPDPGSAHLLFPAAVPDRLRHPAADRSRYHRPGRDRRDAGVCGDARRVRRNRRPARHRPLRQRLSLARRQPEGHHHPRARRLARFKHLASTPGTSRSCTRSRRRPPSG